MADVFKVGTTATPFTVDDAGNVTVTGTLAVTGTASVGSVLADTDVKAVIAVADASGGATDSLLTLDVYWLDGTTRIASARQLMIRFSSTIYSGTADSSPTLGTATAGSIIASLSGIFLVQTDATGNFDCTVTNATDETLYAVAVTSVGGVSDLTKACVVHGCVPDAVTWAA